jgi:hypothetical protein
MPIDIQNLNPSAKFFFDKDEWVELRTIPMSELKEMRKKVVTDKVEYYQPDGKGQPYRYEVEDVDDDKIFEMMWDYQITDWNIVDKEKKKIPCNTENKILLISNSVEFSDFILKSLKQLGKDNDKRRKKSEKN